MVTCSAGTQSPQGRGHLALTSSAWTEAGNLLAPHLTNAASTELCFGLFFKAALIPERLLTQTHCVTRCLYEYKTGSPKQIILHPYTDKCISKIILLHLMLIEKKITEMLENEVLCCWDMGVLPVTQKASPALPSPSAPGHQGHQVLCDNRVTARLCQAGTITTEISGAWWRLLLPLMPRLGPTGLVSPVRVSLQ